MSSVVAVSERLAVHSVLALPQCVTGWLQLRMLVVDHLCATARWQQGRGRRLTALPSHDLRWAHPQQTATSYSTLRTSRPPAGRSSGSGRSRGSERYEGGALVEPGAPDSCNCAWSATTACDQRTTCAPYSGPCASDIVSRGEPIVPPVAKLCLWPQGGHTSSRVASSVIGAPPSPVPRPMSAPWPEAISSGINTGNEVHTLLRASQDLVASIAPSALSRHFRGSDKLKI